MAPSLTVPYTQCGIRIITTDDRPSILRFLREVYYESEPINSYLYRTQPENVRYLDRGVYVAHCIEEGLSLMAVAPNGSVVAILLNEHVKKGKSRSSDDLVEMNPVYPVVKKIVSAVEDQLDVLANVDHPSDKELNLKIICIHPDWRNKGLGAALLRETLSIAKELRFCQLRSACTSAFSAKLFKNFGFQLIYAIRYEDYKENGQIVFKPHAPHTHIQGLVMRLDNCS